MSARRKATAAAYLGVMLKVLVIMVVAYALDGQKPAATKAPMFVVDQAFAQFLSADNELTSDVHGEPKASLKPEVAKALVSLVTNHDLNLDLTVFGKDMSSAVARAATVAQLLRKSGIPTSSLRVVGSWDATASVSSGASMDTVVAVKREI